MTEQEKNKILELAKKFFKTRIVCNHIKNTKKLENLSEFNVNPFLRKYLAQYAFGNSDSKSIAKAMIYPRVLGTSITTSFGTNMQYFCKDVLHSYASTTSGIDIEFVDAMDGRRKYCQVKAGPNTINKDDVTTIKEHFRAIRNLARTNGLPLQVNDCIVGVLYGSHASLSSFYKEIDKDYPVIAGKQFWYSLTGDETFYEDLIATFAEAANEMDSSALLEQTIERLAEAIERNQQST